MVETTVRVYRKLAFLPDLEEGFEIIGRAVEVEEVTLLQKIYTTKSVTKEDKEQLKEILKKNKISKKEKEIIFDLIKGALSEVDINFGKIVNGQEVDKIISQLKEEFAS
jgi:uncharacterized FlgJ-related protein